MLLRIALVLVLAFATVFVALNWATITAPTTIALGFTSVQGPLGLILLGFMAVLAAIFLAFVVYLQAGVLGEMRRHVRELRAQRDAEGEAQAARLTELRGFVASEAERLRSALQQTENSLAADIGELRNRVEDRSGPATPEQ